MGILVIAHRAVRVVNEQDDTAWVHISLAGAGGGLVMRTQKLL